MNQQQADIHTLAGAYALDALPPDEERFFESHLSQCAACRQEVAELRATAAVLASGAAEPAPQGLRERVLAQIDVTRQEPPILDGDVEDQISRTTRLKATLTSVAAAALIVIVGLTAVVARLNGRLDDLEARSGEVYQVLAAEDVRTVEMSTDGGNARVIVSESAGKGVFLAQGLDEAPEGKVYELWLIQDGQPAPAGLFEPDQEGATVQILAGDVSRADAVAVTIEPEGGSPQPTSDPIMVAEV
jgi:anti-sigma-K factor RskA